MENNVQHIECINAYLNNKLSENEIIDFENRLDEDTNFNKLFSEHKTFLEGLKRYQIKTEILKAKQAYIKVKWFKVLGVSTGLLTIAVVVYVLISNLSKTPIQDNNHKNINATLVDTILVEKETDRINVEKQAEIIERTNEEDIEKPSEIKTIKPSNLTNIKSSLEQKEFKTTTVKAPQVLKINTQKDTIITCKEGTRLTIKANSFIKHNGNLVSGIIDLKVTEYYKLSDILLANLSTTSNGQPLETGGMLNLEAFKEEAPLKLKSDIEIAFPTSDIKNNMKLFYGEWNENNVNWRLSSAGQEIEPVIEEIEVGNFEENIDVPFSVVEEVPVYPGCQNGNNQQRRDCTSKAINEFVRKNFNILIADDIGLSGRQSINVIFKINKDGEITDIRSRSREPELELEAERVVALLPKMRPGKQRGKVVSVPYSLPIIFEANGTSKIDRDRSVIRSRFRDSINEIRNARFEAKFIAKDSDRISVAEVNQYALRVSKLGWINCDRFVNNGNTIKYKLKIKEAKDMTRVSMVFKSMRSILPSRRLGTDFDFNMVPKGEEVVLIAIKKQDDKLFMDIIETITQENPNIEFNFKEVALDEIKKQLNLLKNKF